MDKEQNKFVCFYFVGRQGLQTCVESGITPIYWSL